MAVLFRGIEVETYGSLPLEEGEFEVVGEQKELVWCCIRHGGVLDSMMERVGYTTFPALGESSSESDDLVNMLRLQ